MPGVPPYHKGKKRFRNTQAQATFFRGIPIGFFYTFCRNYSILPLFLLMPRQESIRKTYAHIFSQLVHFQTVERWDNLH